jgi:methionyl-tRNA formyltransferase
MRVAFTGAVEGSHIALKALIKAGRAPVLVLTLPQNNSARHSDFIDLTPPAEAAGCAVHYTTDINAPATLNALAAVRPDLSLVIGWSQVCRKPFRDVARHGTIGFHPAALPRLRGRGVIPWTILRNERVTGSTLFWLDDGVDSGPILVQRLFPVATGETARSLYDKHTSNLAEMVVHAVALVESGRAPRTVQDQSQASYCARRTAEDGLIDWNAPAEAVLRLIRAVGEPYPGAYTWYKQDHIRIDKAVKLGNSDRFIGLVGQVQAHTERAFIVLCGDGQCIEVLDWVSSSGKRPPIHRKLGMLQTAP